MEKSKQILLENLSNKIKSRRILLNISQEKLAEKCNLDRTYISLIERAKRNPTYLTLEKLCFGLDIKLNKLLEKTDGQK
jgi:transcriptional regulator with XRE-family HTH domain